MRHRKGFVVNLRLDFCAMGGLFPLQMKPLDHEPKPKFTTEIITEAIAAADSINEIATGAYSQS